MLLFIDVLLGGVTALAVTIDGKNIISGSNDGSIKMLTMDGKEVTCFKGIYRCKWFLHVCK